MEAKCSSETSVKFQPTTQRLVREGRTLHNHRSENLILQYSFRLYAREIQLIVIYFDPSTLALEFLLLLRSALDGLWELLQFDLWVPGTTVDPP
jgi:hypothetical protein